MTAIRSEEPDNHGIATTYRGARFRSRLEAKWASFFDLIGWSWTYEPFDAGNWIPDFLIHGGHPFLVEVGPCITAADYSTKATKPLEAYPPIPTYCERIDHESCHHDDDYIITEAPERITLIAGVTPLYAAPGGWIAAGILTDDGTGQGTDPAVWGRCPTCGQICITHAHGMYTHFPCGHWHDNHVTETGLDIWLFNTWNAAGAQTQWQPFRHRRPSVPGR